jgi:23S rRNA (adenine-N6)-dimethyltransferase
VGPPSAWGWHRLRDDWAARVVALAHIRPGELVVDVGAGRGALTGPLVAAGARVVAVELHPRRAAYLRERFSADRVTVVQVDLAELRFPGRPFRVVANPPYACSAVLLRALLSPHSYLTSADLILPRAVVRRYAQGRAPAANRWLRRWSAAAGASLPRSAFQPPPTVDSQVLVIRPSCSGGT